MEQSKQLSIVKDGLPPIKLGRVSNKYLAVEILANAFNSTEVQELLWKTCRRHRAFLITQREWYMNLISSVSFAKDIEMVDDTDGENIGYAKQLISKNANIGLSVNKLSGISMLKTILTFLKDYRKASIKYIKIGS